MIFSYMLLFQRRLLSIICLGDRSKFLCIVGRWKRPYQMSRQILVGWICKSHQSLWTSIQKQSPDSRRKQSFPCKAAPLAVKIVTFDWHFSYHSNNAIRTNLKQCLFKCPSSASACIVPGGIVLRREATFGKQKKKVDHRWRTTTTL